MRMGKSAPIIALSILLAGASMTYANDGDGKDGWNKEAHHEDGGPQLPEAKAKLVRDAMHEAKEKNKVLSSQARELRKSLHDALVADTFDQAAFLKSSAMLDALRDKMKKNMEEAIASVAGQLTSEEREILASRFHRRHRHEDVKHDDGAPNQKQ